MPTAARMVAGVLFAALAWVVSQLILPQFPEGFDPGLFAEVNAAIGFLSGWVVAGSRARTTWSGAVSYGLTAMVALVFWGLFLHSFWQMIEKSLDRIYDGPADALVDVFQLMFENALLMAVQPVLLALVLGSILAGLVTEVVGRNWR